MVEAAFVTHFPIPPIYPYLPFTPGYLTLNSIAQTEDSWTDDVEMVCDTASTYTW